MTAPIATTAERSVSCDMIESGVRLLRSCTDAPTIFLKQSVVMTLATVVAPYTWLRFGSMPLRCNLFALAVAPSSSCRKGQGISFAQHALNRIDPGTLPTEKDAGVSGILLPSSGSVEGLIDSIAERPATDGLMLAAEFARVLARAKKDFSADLPQILCEAFDGSPIAARSRARGMMRVDNPVLSIYGASAPQPLVEFLRAKDVHSGLLPRFLFAWVENSDVPRVAFPPAINDESRERWIASLRSMREALQADEHRDLSGQLRGREFVLSDDARAAFVEVDAELHNKYSDTTMSAFVERGCPVVLKLAAIVAYGRRQSFTIEPTDVAEGHEWVVASLDGVRRLVMEIDAAEAADFVVEDAGRVKRTMQALRSDYEGRQRIPHRDLLNRSKLDSRRAWDALQHLVEVGDLLPVPTGSRGMGWWFRPEIEDQTGREREESIEAALVLVRDYREKLRGRRG